MRDYAKAVLGTLTKGVLIDIEKLKVIKARDLRATLSKMNFDIQEDGSLTFRRGDQWLNRGIGAGPYAKYAQEIKKLTARVKLEGRMLTL